MANALRGPAVALRGAPQTAAPIIVFVALTGLLQPGLVVPGLGAAGRPAALFGLGLLVWWGLARLLPFQRPATASAILRACFVYAIVFFASVLAGIDRGLPGIEQRGMDRAVLITLGFGGVLLVARDSLRTYVDIDRVATWLVAIGAVGAFIALFQFSLNVNLAALFRIPGLVENSEQSSIATRGDVGYRRVRGLALHPIEFGVHLAMLLPLALHMAMTKNDRKWVRWTIAALLAAGIPLSISRSGFLALAVSMSVFALGLTWRQRANLLTAAVFGTLAFMAVTPGLLGTIRSLFQNASTDNSVSGRTDDYALAGEFVSERPLLGRGPGTFIPSEYILLDNEFLGSLIETGWLGVLALVVVLAAALSTVATLVRVAPTAEARSLARALGAGIAVAPATFATFDALAFPVFTGTLIAMIGCVVGLHQVVFADRTTSRRLVDEYA